MMTWFTRYFSPELWVHQVNYSVEIILNCTTIVWMLKQSVLIVFVFHMHTDIFLWWWHCMLTLHLAVSQLLPMFQRGSLSG